MPYFIKTGLWEKSAKGFKGWLNLNDIFSLDLSSKLNVTNTPVALTDAATIDLDSTKQTLASAAASRTFTISYEGDNITIEVVLSNTAATYTFPATALCVSEGIASGNNTLSLSGVSGDRYIISILKVGYNYYVASKNFGQ